MLRRLMLLTVTMACLAGGSTVCAQENPWSGEPGRFLPQGGNGMWSPYGGYPAMSTPYGSVPSPWSPPPPRMISQGAALPGHAAQPPAKHVYEYLPEGDTRGPFFTLSPEGRRLQRAMEGMYFRVDYLNYKLTDPGEALLGTNYATVDIRNPLADPTVFTASPVFARERDGTVRTDPGGAFVLVPQAHDLSPFELDHRNGIRLTLGFPVEVGTVEGNLWAMQSETDSFRVDPQIRQGLFLVLPAIPLLNNGRVPDPLTDPVVPMILFDDGYHIQFGTDLAGGEVNYLRSLLWTETPVRFEILAGARYTRLYEELFVVGRDDNQQVDPQILATSRNQLFGPSVGLRLEWEREWFKLGAETKFTAGFNRHEDLVRVNDLFQFNRTPIQSTDAHTEFSPVHESMFYAQIKLTHRLKFRIGYNILSLYNVSRPQNAVVWNDSGIIDGPILISADSTNLESFHARGITISGEWSLY